MVRSAARSPRAKAPLWKQPRPVALAGAGLFGLLLLAAGGRYLFFRSGNNAPVREAQAYRNYERQLQEIGDPGTARTAEQLQKIRDSLDALETPPEASSTAARERHTEWLADGEVLACRTLGNTSEFSRCAVSTGRVLRPWLPQVPAAPSRFPMDNCDCRSFPMRTD